MTCKALGGACDLIFKAETFQEIAKQSMEHGKEMFIKKDQAHLKAMGEMKILMQSPEAMGKWMAEKEAEFNALPDID